MAQIDASGGQSHPLNEGQGLAVKSQTSASKPADHSRRELVQLKWLSTLVPGAAVLVYETVRYETLEHLLPGIPPIVGNVAVALLVLLLTYAFASFVFRVVERVQADAVRRGRELAALNAVIDERARLSRELNDGFAQLVAYMLVRLDTVTGLVEATAPKRRLSSWSACAPSPTTCIKMCGSPSPSCARVCPNAVCRRRSESTSTNTRTGTVSPSVCKARTRREGSPHWSPFSCYASFRKRWQMFANMPAHAPPGSASARYREIDSR